MQAKDLLVRVVYNVIKRGRGVLGVGYTKREVWKLWKDADSRPPDWTHTHRRNRHTSDPETKAERKPN